MKIYRIKKLVTGSVIGLQGNFVAVPDINYDNGIRYDDEPFEVECGGKRMKIEQWKNAVTFRVFTDRLKRGQYRLAYFEWKPTTT